MRQGGRHRAVVARDDVAINIRDRDDQSKAKAGGDRRGRLRGDDDPSRRRHATVTPDFVAVMAADTVSVAVSESKPAVSKATLKVPLPLVSVALAGRMARWSLLVKWTVPL